MKLVLIIGSALLMLFAGFTVHNTLDSAIARQQALATQVLTEALASR
jgi:hypothetical protein